MKLPFLKNKETQKEFFLGLILSTSEVRSILFEKTGESLIILGTHKKDFEEQLDLLSSEKLIELADVVISEIEQKLPEGASLDKTIFVVPQRWIQDGKIIKEYLIRLKALCEALHLTPVGFIVSIEAVIAYLHKKEGVPVTAIFVELGKKHVILSLVKNGNILFNSEKEIEDSPVKTVEGILGSQEELEVLPAKIVLLNHENAKKTQQTFLLHAWGKQLQFLHLPQVEVLDPEIEAQAVISGVAAQMGFNLLPQNIAGSIEAKEPVEIAEEVSADSIEEKEDGEVQEESQIEQNSSGLIFDGDKIGFVKDGDILKDAPVTTEPLAHDNVEDVQEKKEEKPREEPVSEHNLDDVPINEPKLMATSGGFKMPKVSLPNLSFLKGKSARGIPVYIYPIAALVLFILIFVGYYYFFEKVEVAVILNKENIEKNMDVTFSTDKPTSAQDSVVHIDVISSQASGKEEHSATGKKDTGDKASGEVTIYNKTDSSKKFPKGTVITGTNSLAFTLNDEVSIASTSSFATTFNSAKAKVTAEKFGKEYNLPSGTNFQIEGVSTSDFFGKNDQAFSGGTKKSVTVVSPDDLADLTDKVDSVLAKEAIANAKGKINSNEELIDMPLESTYNTKTFSKKVGEEASTVNLTASVTYKLGSYKKDDLLNLAKEVTGKEAPGGYSYSSSSSNVQVNDLSTKDDQITGKLVLTAVFLPKVDGSQLVSKIVGKSVEGADSIIRTDGVEDDKITFVRGLPFFPKILPFNKNNIVIVEKTQ